MDIAITGYLVIMVVGVGLIVRNGMVYRHRINLARLVYERNIQTIDKGLAYSSHLWDELNSVSYDRMVLMFWRPLGSFYDPNFLKEIGAK